MERPRFSLRHVALFVSDIERAEAFYRDVLGLRVEWKPDPDNVYMTSGSDNIAIHSCPGGEAERRALLDPKGQRLDHLGFLVGRAEDVDAWATYIRSQGIQLEKEPKTHRDGARSFYFRDPDGNLIQIIHHLPIAHTL